ncbi:uncharacterized protein F5147DRAFT_835180, partial [Suillus discolor]
MPVTVSPTHSDPSLFMHLLFLALLFLCPRHVLTTPPGRLVPFSGMQLLVGQWSSARGADVCCKGDPLKRRSW